MFQIPPFEKSSSGFGVRIAGMWTDNTDKRITGMKGEQTVPTVLPTVSGSMNNYQSLIAPGGTSKSLKSLLS